MFNSWKKKKQLNHGKQCNITTGNWLQWTVDHKTQKSKCTFGQNYLLIYLCKESIWIGQTHTIIIIIIFEVSLCSQKSLLKRQRENDWWESRPRMES